MYAYPSRSLLFVPLVCCFLLGGRWLPAQEFRQLTTLADAGYRWDSIHAMTAFQGKVYNMNIARPGDEKGRFGVVDTATASLRSLESDSEFLGQSTWRYGIRPFQELDGKLFAQFQADPTGGELYRIEGDRAIRLTDLPIQPISELVEFNSVYYFLVAGRPTALPHGESQRARYSELWQTDGTPEGTFLVEELPILNLTDPGVNPFARQLLTAGRESLLISGCSLNFGSNYIQYYLYRPGAAISPVTAPRVNGFGSAEFRALTYGTRPIAAFANGFYLVGTRRGSSAAELLRIEETSAEMRPIGEALRGQNGIFDTWDIRFATVQDSFYLYANDFRLGQRLQVAGPESPLVFRQIDRSPYGSDSRVLTTLADTIYFGGSNPTGVPALLRYVARTGLVDTLFVRREFGRAAELVAGDDVLYFPCNFNTGVGVGRYRIAADSLDLFTGLDPYGMTGSMSRSLVLLGNSVVYLADRQDQRYGTMGRPPMLLDRTASRPRPLLRPTPPPPAGVVFLNGPDPRGNIIFRAPTIDTPGRYFRYEPESEMVTPLAVPDPNELFGVDDIRTTVAGGPLLAYCCGHRDAAGFTIYLPSGDSLKPARYAGSGDTVVIERQWLLNYPLLVEQDENRTSVYRYHFEGLTMVQELRQTIYGSEPKVTYLTDDFIRITVRGEAYGMHTGYLIRPDGSLVYQFDYPSTQAVVASDTVGYYLLDLPTEGQPELIYYAADGAAAIRFPVPQGITPTFPDNLTAGYLMVDNRLVFQPYAPAVGAELYAADPRTGQVSLLRDIHPGAGGSNPHAITRVGGRLYFAAFDPQHGTELWRTDGTPDGTSLVGDLHPGPETSNPTNLTPGEDALYFSATAEAGAEPYAMDYATEAISLLADIHPGPQGSFPEQFIETATGVYLIARPTKQAGPQLFRLSPGQTTTAVTPGISVVDGPVLYPNPTGGPVTLIGQAGEVVDRVRVFDAAGRLLFSLATDANRVELPSDGLLPGGYTVWVRYRSGKAGTARLVVSR